MILEISLGWNYFKLLLETVERYIVVGVLCYTSPLAFFHGSIQGDVNRCSKSWCRMVGSQLLLLVMNVWFLQWGFNSSVGQYHRKRRRPVHRAGQHFPLAVLRLGIPQNCTEV